MAEPFMAEIRLMSFSYAPQGWALCNGQLLPINQNQALFSLMGTTYGGDGRVTFGLPDLRSRVPIHVGPDFTLGQRGGEETHSLTINELPTHTHFVTADEIPATARLAGSNVLAASSNGYAAAAGLTTVAPGTVGNSGGSQPHANMQPYLTISYCIALTGIFPSQN